MWLTLYKDTASAPEVRSEVRIAYTEADEVPMPTPTPNPNPR